MHMKDMKLTWKYLAILFVGSLFVTVYHLSMRVSSNAAIMTTQISKGNTTKKTNKPYVYLIQYSQQIDDSWLEVFTRDDSDVLTLTFSPNTTSFNKRIRDLGGRATIFSPGSTWASGRNQLFLTLRQLESRQNWRYEYIIFIDGDIIFESTNSSFGDPLEIYHALLRDYKPAVGIPSGYGDFGCGGRNPLCNRTQAVLGTCNFDAAVNAFRRDVADYLLPYTEQFDALSWHFCGIVVAVKICPAFEGEVLQACGIKCSNRIHGEYPRADWFSTKNVIRRSIINKAKSDVGKLYSRCISSQWPPLITDTTKVLSNCSLF